MSNSNDHIHHDLSPEKEHFLQEVLEGLKQTPKTLPCKYFYDEAGSHLFNDITKTPEYYLTRTENELMARHTPEMAKDIGAKCLLIEFGSGSSEKISHLLDHLSDVAGYVPVDISREHLAEVTERLKKRYAGLEILAVCADFTNHIELPMPKHPVNHRVIYFPGSTIGNFEPDAASALLSTMASNIEPGDGLLIGIDLKKDVRVLERAYNDAQGVTAAFNKNILRRIRDELGVNVNLDGFEHKAIYDQTHGRIEMHLISQADQEWDVDGEKVFFKKDEHIHTESSYKYTIDEFSQIASTSGFELQGQWTDDRNYFAVLYLTLKDRSI